MNCFWIAPDGSAISSVEPFRWAFTNSSEKVTNITISRLIPHQNNYITGPLEFWNCFSTHLHCRLFHTRQLLSRLSDLPLQSLYHIIQWEGFDGLPRTWPFQCSKQRLPLLVALLARMTSTPSGDPTTLCWSMMVLGASCAHPGRFLKCADMGWQFQKMVPDRS